MRAFVRVTMLVAALGAIAACSPQPLEVQQMNSPLQPDELAVRQMIGYDALVASIDPASGIALEWPALATFLPAGSDGWEEIADDVDPAAPSLIQRKAIYRKGEVTVTFRIAVSGDGPKPALAKLIET